MSGRGLSRAGQVAAAVFTVAVLCWPVGPTPSTRLAQGRARASARLTAYSAGARAGRNPGCNPLASLRPAGPPVVTPLSFMAKIRARGYLIAGVDLNTYHFGYLNPRNERIEGFDIDMLHAIAAAIFGNPDKIKFIGITDDQRIPAVQSGKVDIVAHTMTINCARRRSVDFSTVYFDAHQRVLVPSDSRAQSIADLAGQRVCATAGSDSLARIVAKGAVGVPVASWTDCLVRLQQGDVAAISTDDSILAGLTAQDPYTKIVGPPMSNEPYGLAISKQHPDFVRFVNAVLARLRADGQWAASYRRWIGGVAPLPPAARYQG